MPRRSGPASSACRRARRWTAPRRSRWCGARARRLSVELTIGSASRGSAPRFQAACSSAAVRRTVRVMDGSSAIVWPYSSTSTRTRRRVTLHDFNLPLLVRLQRVPAPARLRFHGVLLLQQGALLGASRTTGRRQLGGLADFGGSTN